MSPRAVVPALAVLAAAGGVWWMTRERPPATTPAPTSGPSAPAVPPIRDADAWRPEPVRVTHVPRFETVAARLACAEPVHATSTTHAPVLEILCRPGDAVRKGDVLVRLDGAAWVKERDAARAAGDGKRAAAAEAMLEGIEVRAPADGVVYRVEAERGRVPMRTRAGVLPLVTLFDWTAATVEGTAPAKLADLFPVGGAVRLRVQEGMAPTVAGIVIAAEPAGEGRVRVRARLAEPPGAALVPDAEASISVVVGERRALVVPRGAVAIGDRGATVRVVPVSGDPQPVPVTLGEALPNGMLEIRAGLEEFQSVVVPQ